MKRTPTKAETSAVVRRLAEFGLTELAAAVGALYGATVEDVATSPDCFSVSARHHFWAALRGRGWSIIQIASVLGGSTSPTRRSIVAARRRGRHEVPTGVYVPRRPQRVDRVTAVARRAAGQTWALEPGKGERLDCERQKACLDAFVKANPRGGHGHCPSGCGGFVQLRVRAA
jgi:hypothetical protein